jgi:hypothetical protein
MVVTLLLAEYLDAVVIGAVLLFDAVIGFLQDQEADSRGLVVGDTVLLGSGVRVPADLRPIPTGTSGRDRRGPGRPSLGDHEASRQVSSLTTGDET